MKKKDKSKKLEKLFEDAKKQNDFLKKVSKVNLKKLLIRKG